MGRPTTPYRRVPTARGDVRLLVNEEEATDVENADGFIDLDDGIESYRLRTSKTSGRPRRAS